MFPTSTEILQTLERITNELVILGLIFHLLTFMIVIALLSGWRPYNKIFTALMSLLLLSVGTVSICYGNAFNGFVFIISFVVLMIFTLRMQAEKIELNGGWFLLSGIMMLAFGWIYPHFTNNSYAYFVAGPLGLIPCPTLSLIIGFTLLFKGFGARKWSFTLAIIGLFYGVFGAWKLNVAIDLFLVAGSLILFILALRMQEQKPANRQKSITPTFN